MSARHKGRRLALGAAIVAAAWVTAGCRKAAEPDPASRPDWIERIGDRLVDPGEFDRFLEREIGMAPAEIDAAVRARLYEDFLAEILFARAAARLGLHAPEQELATEIELLASIAPDQPPETVRREAERTVLAREYERQVLYREIQVGDDEVVQVLGKERRLSRRNVIVFRQIMVDTKEAAREAHRRITRGREPFDEVARQISQSGVGGELQQRRLDSLPQEASRVLERLPEGAISKPVEIGGMWYLFEVTARNYDPDPGREREREVARHRLFQEKLERARAARLAELARQENVRAPRVGADAVDQENGS